ncbi:MAG: hypothetical protein K2O35_05880 [Clostridia bacterium]|nr:hypothetical protein [Clostridia bacterium]
MKRFIYAIVVLLLTLVSVSLLGCTLEAEDCYVFDDEEFASLRLEDNFLADASAVRIMSANVLVSMKSWGGEPVKPRAHRFAEAIKHYSPDVIGAQEMCKDWYKYLMPQICETYEIVQPKNSLFTENRTPIIYNKKKLQLLESGLVKYSKGDKNACRVVTYGVFDTLADGKRMIVTSTHLDLIRMNDYEKEKSIMLSQVAEFFETIETLENKYNCPIFMTGDYNSMEREDSRYLGQASGAEYKKENDLTYYKCYGKPCGAFVYEQISAKYVDVKFIKDIDTKFDNTRGYLYDDPTWDHIFLNNADKAKILTFRVLASDYFHNNLDRSSRISDHLPICVDAVLE